MRWIVGDATALPPLQVDLATMTANVAQVFVTDEAWLATLHGARRSLRPGGHLVFESRDREQAAWLGWNRAASHRRTDVPVGAIETWVELTEVALPLVSFRWTFRFEADGAVLTSDSTLRFRTEDGIVASLEVAGFVTEDVRDAPDRPGCELVSSPGRRTGRQGDRQSETTSRS